MQALFFNCIPVIFQPENWSCSDQQRLIPRQKEIQRIYDSLTLAIAQHKLRPGTRLIEAQIVETLGANRNHVQAALQRMALQHIVTVEPNVGACVSQPSATTDREFLPPVTQLKSPSSPVLLRRKSQYGASVTGLCTEVPRHQFCTAGFAFGRSPGRRILFTDRLISPLFDFKDNPSAIQR